MGKNKYPLDDFEGLYREHMFLHHPLVPDSVKQSQSDIINIRDLISTQKLNEEDTNALLKALKEFDDYSVIRLSNLSGITIKENYPLWERFSGI